MSVPLFGKISDIYGRRQVFQVTIVIFLVGSMLAGIAQTMTQLILFRGIQGIGGGGLLAMTFTILGDILSPRERPKYMGYFTGVFAAASVIGPLIGGFFVDNLSWRWVFYVNIPIGIVALLVTAKYLHVPDPTERRPIDFLGSVLFAVAVTTLLLGATWGGTEYAWTSPTIVGLFGAGVLFSVAVPASGAPGGGAAAARCGCSRTTSSRCRIVMGGAVRLGDGGRLGVPAAVPPDRARRLGHVVGIPAGADDGRRPRRLHLRRAPHHEDRPLQAVSARRRRDVHRGHRHAGDDRHRHDADVRLHRHVHPRPGHRYRVAGDDARRAERGRAG